MSVVVVTNDAERAGDPARAATAVCGKLSCISAILPPSAILTRLAGLAAARHCASVDGGAVCDRRVWFQGSDGVGSAWRAANSSIASMRTGTNMGLATKGAPLSPFGRFSL